MAVKTIGARIRARWGPVGGGGPGEHVQRLAAEALAGRAPSLLIRSGSRVDVGEWFGGGRLWLAAGPGVLALVAAGRRPFAERRGVDEIGGSFYNGITGELVIAPATGRPWRRVRLAPVEAHRVLEALGVGARREAEDKRSGH